MMIRIMTRTGHLVSGEVMPLENFLEVHNKTAVAFYTREDHDEIVGMSFLMGYPLHQNRGVIGIDFSAEDTGAYIMTMENKRYWFDPKDHIWKSDLRPQM